MKAHLMLNFLSSDPYLGRIDYASLSQQTLMELLTERITNRKRFCNSTENPTEIFTWRGLKFDDANDIVKINWICNYLEGCIELKWLPSTLKECYLHTNLLEGTIDLTCLPDSLETLSMASNKFEGTVDLTNLPVV